MPRDKSIGWALILTFLLGPLGLLYVTVLGGLFLVLISVVLTAFLHYEFAPAITWLTSIPWGAVGAARKHHLYQSWLAEQSLETRFHESPKG